MRGAARVQFAQIGPHAAADLDVDAGGGLVQNQQPRPVHQCPGDHQAALHAAGQQPHLALATIPEIELAQVKLGAGAGLRARNAEIAGLVDHHLGHRQKQVEVELLGHDAEQGLDLFGFPVEIVTEHLDAAAGLVHQRRQDADQRRLAGPIRTQQRKEIAFFDGEVDALQGLESIAIGLAKLASNERGHGLVGTWWTGRRRRARKLSAVPVLCKPG